MPCQSEEKSVRPLPPATIHQPDDQSNGETPLTPQAPRPSRSGVRTKDCIKAALKSDLARARRRPIRRSDGRHQATFRRATEQDRDQTKSVTRPRRSRAAGIQQPRTTLMPLGMCSLCASVTGSQLTGPCPRPRPNHPSPLLRPVTEDDRWAQAVRVKHLDAPTTDRRQRRRRGVFFHGSERHQQKKHQGRQGAESETPRAACGSHPG
jgi:hypothetical protein